MIATNPNVTINTPNPIYTTYGINSVITDCTLVKTGVKLVSIPHERIVQTLGNVITNDCIK